MIDYMKTPNVKVISESSHSMIDESFYGENLASTHAFDNLSWMNKLRDINVIKDPNYVRNPGYYLDTEFVNLYRKDVQHFIRWLETVDRFVPSSAQFYFCQFKEPTTFNGNTPSFTEGLISSKRCYGIIKCFMTFKGKTETVHIFRTALENYDLAIGQDLLNLFNQ